MWPGTELMLSSPAAQQRRLWIVTRTADGSGTRSTSEKHITASLCLLHTCCPHELWIPLPRFLRKASSLSRVRFLTGEEVHPLTLQTAQSHTDTWNLSQGKHESRSLWGWQATSGETWRLHNKRKSPNSLSLPVLSDFIRMEDNGGKDINHLVGQDPFRVPTNHFRDASSLPLPPRHHLSASVEISAQH